MSKASIQMDSTIRWKLMNDSPLNRIERERLITIIGDQLGYPPPDGEQDDDGGRNKTIEESAYSEIWYRGAGFSRTALKAKGVCFHHAAGTFGGTIDWLTKSNRRKNASYHVLIDQDGSRARIVDDRYRAYHAGAKSSNFRGTNPNHTMLSVAFTGDTVTGKWRDRRELNEAEIDSAVQWIMTRWEPMGLSMDWVTDHRTCDPTRRNDLAPDQLEVLRQRLGEAVNVFP